jgi:hypothetical protein
MTICRAPIGPETCGQCIPSTGPHVFNVLIRADIDMEPDQLKAKEREGTLAFMGRNQLTAKELEKEFGPVRYPMKYVVPIPADDPDRAPWD